MSAEILAPAGDEATAYAALNAGADAVYLGLSRFSAREGAANLDGSALSRVARYAHLLGAKVYVALNTLIKDGETEDFLSSLRTAWEQGADAILMQDMFLGGRVKELYPEVILHLSTQAGCCNVHGAELAKKYGFSRVVLARETPIGDIPAISQIIETEVFVQGALCTCFSGQCFLSSFAGNNSGNRGRCKQPCRKKYKIDREGYEDYAYSLSLSDLSLGGKIKELLAAGVSSLKIEGRMRRPAYCEAAVRYYRAISEGKEGAAELSALRRAYNRGDYTEGLGFGQTKSLLSRLVQGHIGEDVGEISLVRGKYFCKSAYPAAAGDGFKLLRGGREVGGAAFAQAVKGGFFLSSSEQLRTGDRVRLTTWANAPVLPPVKRKISVEAAFMQGERAKISCGEVCVESEAPLAAAKNAPLTEEGITECLQKTDGLPIFPEVTVRTNGVFVPKSALNALRREFYAALAASLAPAREALPAKKLQEPAPQKGTASLSAYIGEAPRKKGEIFICKPADYRDLKGNKEAYLYLPPLFTAADEALVAPHFKEYKGVFAEGYYGFALAKKYGVSLFAGFGVPVTNRFAADEAGKNADYFTLSKEISLAEQRALAGDKAFLLAEGAIKVMDLCYCPFERTCERCDKRREYTLTDEDGRKFPLRRYRAAEGCRFEVYNCAALSCPAAASPIADGSVKAPLPATRGHSERSML